MRLLGSSLIHRLVRLYRQGDDSHFLRAFPRHAKITSVHLQHWRSKSSDATLPSWGSDDEQVQDVRSLNRQLRVLGLIGSDAPAGPMTATVTELSLDWTTYACRAAFGYLLAMMGHYFPAVTRLTLRLDARGTSYSSIENFRSMSVIFRTVGQSLPLIAELEVDPGQLGLMLYIPDIDLAACLPSLRKLDLSSCFLSPSLLRHLARMPRLEELRAVGLTPPPNMDRWTQESGGNQRDVMIQSESCQWKKVFTNNTSFQELPFSSNWPAGLKVNYLSKPLVLPKLSIFLTIPPLIDDSCLRLCEAPCWRLRQPIADEAVYIACASTRLAEAYQGVFGGPLILVWPFNIEDYPDVAVKIIAALRPLSGKVSMLKLCGWGVTPKLLAEITLKLQGTCVLYLSGCKVHSTVWLWLQAQGHHWKFTTDGVSKAVTIQICKRLLWQ